MICSVMSREQLGKTVRYRRHTTTRIADSNRVMSKYVECDDGGGPFLTWAGLVFLAYWNWRNNWYGVIRADRKGADEGGSGEFVYRFRVLVCLRASAGAMDDP